MLSAAFKLPFLFNYTCIVCTFHACMHTHSHIYMYMFLAFSLLPGAGEPGITGCGGRSNIYLGECGLAHKLTHWSLLRNFIFPMLNFHGWSWPRNYFTSKIFPMYGTLYAICMYWGCVHVAPRIYDTGFLSSLHFSFHFLPSSCLLPLFLSSLSTPPLHAFPSTHIHTHTHTHTPPFISACHHYTWTPPKIEKRETSHSWLRCKYRADKAARFRSRC